MGNAVRPEQLGDKSEIDSESSKKEVNDKAVKNKAKQTYHEEINALIEEMDKDECKKDCTFDELVQKYSKKNKDRVADKDKKVYSQKVIAGAYYKFTRKEDQLDLIDYQRILKEKRDPVKQDGIDSETQVKNHAHHIVYKRGKKGEEEKNAKEGRELLWKYDIDPVLDHHNLVAAPNTGHSPENIKEVVDQLKAAEKKALDECDERNITDPEKRKEEVQKKLYECLDKCGKAAKARPNMKKKKKKTQNEKKKGESITL